MTSTCDVDKYGTKRWRNSKNQFHREDGPAIEHENGYKAWYLNGQRHREDGPAIEWADGEKAWFLHDQKYSFKNYCKELLERKLITATNLSLFKLKYGE